MKICQLDHRYEERFNDLPHDQGGAGRHRCCGCAYASGFGQGVARAELIDFALDALPESQAGTVRHKSPHAAFAMGYLDGVRQSYA